jgi:hypothetical protein
MLPSDTPLFFVVMIFPILLFIFVCPKTNQKGQPFTRSAFSGIPCAARKEPTIQKVVSLR